jgi:AcrR family transcriptional regulator
MRSLPGPVAKRAGVAAPSLCGLFADREDVVDALLERHLDQLSAYIATAERAWIPTLMEEFVECEVGQ